VFDFRIPRYKFVHMKHTTGKNVGIIYVTLGGDDDVNADSDLNYSGRYWLFAIGFWQGLNIECRI